VSIPLLRDAARCFFRGPHTLSASASTSGLSGSSLARVETRGAAWCLRRWPTGFEERRLRFIHRALLHCREGGFTGVPALAKTGEGDTVLDLDGHLFDAQEWLTGDPLSGRLQEPTPNVVRPLEPEILASLSTAVARFHRSAADLAPERDRETPLSEHLAESARDGRVRHEALLAGVQDSRAEGGNRRIALRWLELLPIAIALAEATVSDHPLGARSVSTLCHGDLWAPHVFFAGKTFVGLADFEGLCFSSPASDLAQLIVHFNGWPARDTVVDAYKGVSPLDGEDEAVLSAAAVADLAWEGYWSLGLLYGKGPGLGLTQKETHETNLRMLLGSLELVVAEIEEYRG
jgi:Ser/Thr protein kinase RdoA (MazF antagonist)